MLQLQRVWVLKSVVFVESLKGWGEKPSSILWLNEVSQLMWTSQIAICSSDTATHLILSQFESSRAGLVFPTVTGAMFVCGDMAP